MGGWEVGRWVVGLAWDEVGRFGLGEFVAGGGVVGEGLRKVECWRAEVGEGETRCWNLDGGWSLESGLREVRRGALAIAEKDLERGMLGKIVKCVLCVWSREEVVVCLYI